MLELKDFIHLPQVDLLFEQMAQDSPGLVIVAGLEPRSLAASVLHGAFQPSGRSAIFGILARQVIAQQRSGRALILVETRDALRIPPRRRQVELALVRPPDTFAGLMGEAIRRRVRILVVERLTAETAPLALEAAQQGIRVISQLDTVFRGAEVARQLLDDGVPGDRLGGLAWVVAVQRLPTLCPHCKRPERLSRARLAEVRSRFAGSLPEGTFFRAGQCPECNRTGRLGDVAVFDIYRANPDAPGPFEEPSVLSLEQYVLGLAALGHLPVDDVLRLDADRLHRTYRLLAASEEALAQANATLRSKLAELEVAGQVLHKQTEASISLQEVGHALITLTELKDLARFVCRKARDLCDADRVVLYLLRPDHSAEILAVHGWDQGLVHRRLDMPLVFGSDAKSPLRGQDPAADAEPALFLGSPPGIPAGEPDIEGVRLRAGLRVPLVAQHEVIGLLIFHSTLKSHFAPREVALLRAFADQSALAIQRAGLVESLRDKIDRLEAAQAEIAKKERLERELELARQVQQSMLPRAFPLLPGFEFAARSEPARQVGGDFYDVFVLDADRVGIVIADVVDKGMPAALYMALTRSLLLAEARRERSPAVVLNRVHRLLLELSQPSLFVTVFYGVLDATARTLTYARAGHERPLLWRDGTATALPGEGTVLGLPDIGELPLDEERIDLHAGDRLFLYTDGLADAPAPDGEAFGLKRLLRLLYSHAGSSLDDLCSAALADVSGHQGAAEQYDDMTILAVEVK